METTQYATSVADKLLRPGSTARLVWFGSIVDETRKSITASSVPQSIMTRSIVSVMARLTTLLAMVIFLIAGPRYATRVIDIGMASGRGLDTLNLCRFS